MASRQPVRMVVDSPPSELPLDPEMRDRRNPWLRLASWQGDQRTIDQREKARRSRLLAWIILGLLIATGLLVPLGIGDAGTLLAVAGFGAGLVIAAILNRQGLVTLAGSLVVFLLSAAVAFSLLSFPLGLTVDTLPAYDLLTASTVAAATVLPRRATFLVAAGNTTFIVADFFLQAHYVNLTQTLQDTRLWPSVEVATAAFLARPIALQVVIAVVSYLWVRGTDEAIRRADRAEEIAALEHSIAEQKRQLDIGISQLLQTHVRAANGDFGARAPLSQENVLWQIASSLNNLLARMQRAAQADHQLARTEEELRRLAAAIDDAQAGRMPLWPAPTGTAADLILERIARGQRRRSVPSAAHDQGRSSGFGQTPASQGWPSISSQPLAHSPFGQPPSSQPLGQSPYGADGWPPAAPQQGQMEPPPPSPWIIPAEPPQQPEQPQQP